MESGDARLVLGNSCGPVPLVLALLEQPAKDHTASGKCEAGKDGNAHRLFGRLTTRRGRGVAQAWNQAEDGEQAKASEQMQLRASREGQQPDQQRSSEQEGGDYASADDPHQLRS